MAIKTLFPTKIDYGPLGASKALLSELRNESYTYMEMDEAGAKWCEENYLNGYTSYSSITDLPYRSPTFGELKSLIDKRAKTYAKSLRWDLADGNLEMSTCWINIMGQGCHHSFHFHPYSVISGTFYVQVPKDSGGFKIEDPRIQNFMARPGIKVSAEEWAQPYISLSPAPGDLVLFESYLKHEVPANNSEVERVSISFNYSLGNQTRV